VGTWCSLNQGTHFEISSSVLEEGDGACQLRRLKIDKLSGNFELTMSCNGGVEGEKSQIRTELFSTFQMEGRRHMLCFGSMYAKCQGKSPDQPLGHRSGRPLCGCPPLASGFQGSYKIATIHASSGVIWGMSVTLTLVIGAVGFALGYSVREFISRRRRRVERRRRAMGFL
jgi:hypothetical protein